MAKVEKMAKVETKEGTKTETKVKVDSETKAETQTDKMLEKKGVSNSKEESVWMMVRHSVVFGKGRITLNVGGEKTIYL